MKGIHHLSKQLAFFALVAVLASVLLWSFHTHPDGSPRGAENCVVCQIAHGLTAGLAVVAVAFTAVLQLLTHLVEQRAAAPLPAPRSCRRSRAPPLPA